MKRGDRSTKLLTVIAETLGTDVGAFVALRQPEVASDIGLQPAADPARSILLLRLIRTFNALPTDETRLQALQILESYACRIEGGNVRG